MFFDFSVVGAKIIFTSSKEVVYHDTDVVKAFTDEALKSFKLTKLFT